MLLYRRYELLLVRATNTWLLSRTYTKAPNLDEAVRKLASGEYLYVEYVSEDGMEGRTLPSSVEAVSIYEMLAWIEDDEETGSVKGETT